MNIYVDFRHAKTPDELTQAIKVFALTNKNINVKVLINDETNHTFNEEKNLKVVKSIEDEEYYLLTTDQSYNEGDLAFIMLKTMGNKKIVFGDLSLSSKLEIEDKLKILKEKLKLGDKVTYSLMSVAGLNCEEINKFNETVKDDKNYLGIIAPHEIYDTFPDICLTTPLVANVFISSLTATLKFVNTKNKNKEESRSTFSKIFSNFGKFNDTESKEEKINYLLDECIIYYQNKNIIAKTKPDGNYAFYFAILNTLRDNLI